MDLDKEEISNIIEGGNVNVRIDELKIRKKKR